MLHRNYNNTRIQRVKLYLARRNSTKNKKTKKQKTGVAYRAAMYTVHDQQISKEYQRCTVHLSQHSTSDYHLNNKKILVGQEHGRHRLL